MPLGQAPIDRPLKALDAETVAKFAADLAAHISPDDRIGIAVSGGPDSLALLALSVAALGHEHVAAATVDHRLRVEATEEAAMVAELCGTLDISHDVLTLAWPEGKPTSGVQGAAREARYAALDHWAKGKGLSAVAVGQHADDQAETLLMRLARGAGVKGLAGIRPSRPLSDTVELIRPLLGWRRRELATIVEALDWHAIDDPSNSDRSHERSRMRTFLDGNDMFEAMQLAASAAHLADADEALTFAAERLFEGRFARDGDTLVADPGGLPKPWRRRFLETCFAEIGAAIPRGREVDHAFAMLEAGKSCTLAGYKLEVGEVWRFSPVPPHRT